MYGLIIRISDERLTEEDYEFEEDYEDLWLGDQYVEDAEELDENGMRIWADVMNTQVPGLVVDENTGVISVISKAEYFKIPFESFCKAAENLSKMSLEAFIEHRSRVTMKILLREYDYSNDIYVDCDGEVGSLDSWVRSDQTIEGQPWYIYGMFEYELKGDLS
ncbi:MAG: hypothetical protein IKF90_26370 [Parasporobacterium sp.]|nr:hypothetical protein [Parasporobacterium sp.]